MERFKNLNFDEFKVDIRHFLEPNIVIPPLKDFIKESILKLSDWLIKISILSGKHVSISDVIQTHENEHRDITYSYTIPKEDMLNAIQKYSENENSEILLSKFFKIYNEMIEKK
jgi:hypothetical protein